MSGLPPFLFNFLFVIRSTCSILLRIMLLSNLFVRLLLLLLRLFFYMLLFYLIETLFILIICHCLWYHSLINTCLFNSLTVPWTPFSPSPGRTTFSYPMCSFTHMISITHNFYSHWIEYLEWRKQDNCWSLSSYWTSVKAG